MTASHAYVTSTRRQPESKCLAHQGDRGAFTNGACYVDAEIRKREGCLSRLERRCQPNLTQMRVASSASCVGFVALSADVRT
eukprot:2402579-Amphidinium_carterae.1